MLANTSVGLSAPLTTETSDTAPGDARSLSGGSKWVAGVSGWEVDPPPRCRECGPWLSDARIGGGRVRGPRPITVDRRVICGWAGNPGRRASNRLAYNEGPGRLKS